MELLKSLQAAALGIRILLILCSIGLLTGIIGVMSTDEHSSIRFFDNLHWTAGTTLAMLFSWLAVQRAEPQYRPIYLHFAIGLTLYQIGQLIWDAQVWLEYDAFPSPSDVLYLCLGPFLCSGLLIASFHQLKGARRTGFLLDCGLMATAALTLILSLYLPYKHETSTLEMITLIAYPSSIFIALGIGLMMIPTLYLRPNPGYMLFLIAIFATGLSWMMWNLLALNKATLDGSWLNGTFSIGISILGASTLTWRCEPTTQLSRIRISEGILRILPLFAIIASCTALALTQFQEGLSAIASTIIQLGAITAIALAFVRQTLLLQDYKQLQTTLLQLEHSEQLTRLILETIPDIVWMKDLDGKFVICNPQFEQLLNTPEENIIGKTDFEFSSREEALFFQQKDTEALHKHAPNKNEEWLTHRASGNRILFETIKTPVRNRAGSSVGVLGVARDITARHLAETNLKESEERLRLLGDNLPGGYIYQYGYRKHGETYYRYLSAGVEKIHGLSVQEIIATPQQLINQADLESLPEFLAAEARSAERMENFSIDMRFTNAQGQERWINFRSHPHRLQTGEIVWDGIAIDITQQKQNEKQLQLAARVFSESREGIVIADTNNIVIDVNPNFCETTGFDRNEIIGKPSQFLNLFKFEKHQLLNLRNHLSLNGYWQGDVEGRRKNGERYIANLIVSTLKDGKGRITNYIGMLTDVTQEKEQQKTLHMLAHYDPLTHLPNRVLFDDRFKQAIARCKRESSMLAVCYMDLDGFKHINDSHGHEMGDKLLIQAAKRIQSCLREQDTVSRMGGDEFALLLGSVKTLEQVENALKRIHSALSQPFIIDEKILIIGASSGVTVYPTDDSDAGTLIRHADQAMYQAKQDGRNRFVHFDISQESSRHKRLNRLEEINIAFKQHQFCLYYQPKINMKTGIIMGFEALLRWQHPSQGLLLPGEFLPSVKDTAMESVMGEWVIEEALTQISRWYNAGLNMKVSVNVSPNYMANPNFSDHLISVLANYPPYVAGLLEIELLEDGKPVDTSTARSIITNCQSQTGVAFALDDFGAGHLSLAQLQQLPVNTLKIDPVFVRDMITDKENYALVESMIGLAHSFQRTVIAGGVETIDHGLALMKMGCEIGQGYAIAPPMPAHTVPDWIKAGHSQVFSRSTLH